MNVQTRGVVSSPTKGKKRVSFCQDELGSLPGYIAEEKVKTRRLPNWLERRTIQSKASHPAKTGKGQTTTSAMGADAHALLEVCFRCGRVVAPKNKIIWLRRIS